MDGLGGGEVKPQDQGIPPFHNCCGTTPPIHKFGLPVFCDKKTSACGE